ncbi:intermembrane transport protein PqiB [Thiolapillus sp.]|uniref:PqiB family protein n=2 Tax=Thiolapillus sp. TaxID=2017437 RepID=UPI0025D34905|nr:MlaD family protein [Thiolapillus sp.]
MKEQNDRLEELPEALVAADHPGFSFVWLVPLVALIIGIVLIYKEYSSLGPSVEIRFQSAEGIEPNKTEIKYRDVVIGKVKNLQFTDDLSHVMVEAQLNKDMESLLSSDTRFWVVRPRIGATGASGISTLFSGVYIAVDPGEAGAYTQQFVGLEEPPKILSDARGSSFRLRAKSLGSISIGSLVYHRQIQVGEVTGYRLVPEQDYVALDVFINEPANKLVRRNTRFWNVSGMDVEVTGGGVKVEMESLTSLLAGGVAFDSALTLGDDQPAAEGTEFQLYESREESQKKVIQLSLPYILYFDDSVRGLSVGASVEFRGIPVGKVLDISLEESIDDGLVRIAVLVGLEPDLVPFESLDPGLDEEERKAFFHSTLEKLVAKGLRARLITGNLLSGQLIVDMDFDKEAEMASIDYSGKYPVLPTTTGSLTSITNSLVAILGKLKRLPLDEMGEHFLKVSEGMDALVNSEGLLDSVKSLSLVLDHADQILSIVGDKTTPMLDEMARLSTDARKMVQQAEKTLQQLEKSASDQGSMGGELINTMRELAAAARAVRGVADYLERHPEALLQGKAR